VKQQQQQQQQIRGASPTENLPAAAPMMRNDQGRGGGAYRMADRQQPGVRRGNADFQPNWRDRDPGAMDRIGDRFRRFGVCILLMQAQRMRFCEVYNKIVKVVLKKLKNSVEFESF
jgi:hypothetical protein